MYKYLITCLLFSQTLIGQTCHFIVFCDTDDSRLMVPASQSYSFFADELPERVKQHTGMNISYHCYKSSQFTASNLDSKLSSLSVGSNDVIFFWFDGHGYNAGDNDWPTLSFPQSNTRSLNTIFNTLKGKGARLVIALANACNKERTSRANYAQHNYIVQNQSEDETAERYKDLFLRSKGNALVASSQKGETSQSGQFGAWFFLAFREKFDDLVDGNNGNTAQWEQLIKDSQSRTSAIADDAGYTQNPIRYVSIASTSPPTINIEMIYVKGGTFTMGCTGEQVTRAQGGSSTMSAGSYDCASDESPTHSVTISSFYIGKYEVTQKQWQDIMGTNPSHNAGCDNCPVEQVSREDIQTFIQKLNNKTGKNYRLPTESEWEFAARGGNNCKYYKYAGSSTIDDVAWYDKNSYGKTQPVGKKTPNELGIYDMSGNVAECCSDWYGAYTSSSQSDPSGASKNSMELRIIRGGSFRDYPNGCRVSKRDAGVSTGGAGFRLVLVP